MLFQTCTSFFLVEHKRRYFEETNSPRWHLKKYYRSQWGPSTVWLPAFFKISSMFHIRKKLEEVELRMTKFSFLGELSLSGLKKKKNLIECNLTLAVSQTLFSFMLQQRKKMYVCSEVNSVVLFESVWSGSDGRTGSVHTTDGGHQSHRSGEIHVSSDSRYRLMHLTHAFNFSATPLTVIQVHL